MRAILLTSTFRRHVFVANTVAAGCDLVGVWQEEKTLSPGAIRARMPTTRP